jgi:hypothetical protein
MCNKTMHVGRVQRCVSSYSRMDMPQTSLRISPEGLGGLSLTDLPGVDAWLKGAIEGGGGNHGVCSGFDSA